MPSRLTATAARALAAPHAPPVVVVAPRAVALWLREVMPCVAPSAAAHVLTHGAFNNPAPNSMEFALR